MASKNISLHKRAFTFTHFHVIADIETLKFTFYGVSLVYISNSVANLFILDMPLIILNSRSVKQQERKTVFLRRQ